jgi:hypothetical protein
MGGGVRSVTVRRTKEGALSERVARALFGAPTSIDAEKGSARFGDIAVNLVTGRFFDYEDEAGGDHLDLIRRTKGLENGEAEKWLDANIIKAPRDMPAELAGERTLLGLLCHRPELMAAIQEDIVAVDFSTPFHRQLFDAIEQAPADTFVPMATVIGAGGGDMLAPMVEAEGYTLGLYVSTMLAEAPNTVPDAAHFARALAVQIRTATNRSADYADEYDADPEPPPFEPTMGLRMWEDQDQPGQQYDYLIEDLIPERQLVVLMGESGTGKSFLTFSMAMALARGVPFLGRRILRPIGVIWCAYEAAEGASARMRAYRRHHGLSLDPLPFAALQHPLPLWPNEPNGDRLINEILGIQRTRFNGIPLGMIVVDTYNAATPGASEIDSEVVSRIRAYFRRVVEATGATILIVGHTNAAGKHRGNEQLTNNVDTILKVSMKTTMVGRDAVQLKDEDGRKLRTLLVRKQREGRDGDEFDFVLHSVKDGTFNKFGAERTSCVIVPFEGIADSRGREPTEKGPRLSHERTVILQALRTAMAEYSEPPPSALKLPRAISRVVHARHWKEIYLQKMPDHDLPPENTINKRLRDASAQFQNLSIIGRINPFVWLTGKQIQETPSPSNNSDD